MKAETTIRYKKIQTADQINLQKKEDSWCKDYKNQDKRFKFYVVIHSKVNDIFQTWPEVIDSIKDIEKSLFKGSNDFTEALDYAKGILGPNYYISAALRQNLDKIPQYNIQKDTDKVIFCDHCSSMTKAFKRLNQKNETLIQEKARLMEQVRMLEHRLQAVKFELVQSQSFPSQDKMDETGHIEQPHRPTLKYLHLKFNFLQGELPSSIFASPYIKVEQFHGPISTRQKLCFLRLRIFDLSHNEFSGSLPAEVFQNFKAMIKDGTDKGDIRYMELDSTDAAYEDLVRLVIKGQETELERISTIMIAINLSSNHFEGVIPKAITDLGSLRLLNLSRNNLRGHIPLELGKFNMLEALDLPWNQLTRKISREFARMNFLAILNLSQNLLVGPIPQGPQFYTFENESYGGNLDLCGPPLSKQCGMSNLLEFEEENESYFLSGFTWESVVIGYSCGLVVGTVMWSLMFKARKPKWVVEFLEGAFPKKMRRP
ncbi:receptor-like protein 9DC3 [Lycium barbarum]|uniref:receptor-like protein 9DC3 n=1 Tax=Lycium barbarum TaxID=112863 RepID=UPI00293EE40B|nr:receptor-like protein 9DC3 [Lycium barbarum]